MQPNITDELLYRFEFPERSGALLHFLTQMGERWNISLFHYRNHGAAYGRVLMGIQVPPQQTGEFQAIPGQPGNRLFRRDKQSRIQDVSELIQPRICGVSVKTLYRVFTLTPHIQIQVFIRWVSTVVPLQALNLNTVVQVGTAERYFRLPTSSGHAHHSAVSSPS